MPLEIERKFLVDKQKWKSLEKPEGKLYQQGYISNQEGITVRVRSTPHAGFITIKGKTTGATRAEYEYEIPLSEAKELLNSFCSNKVTKHRYEIQYAGKIWEVDEFMNENDGLIVAEIELESEEETFDKPGWVEKEVTEDDRYFNSNLVKNPFSSWPDIY